MDNVERKRIYLEADKMITNKLEALRDTIWSHTKDVPEEELEEFVRNIKISAVFTQGVEDYAAIQGEISSMLSRRVNGQETNSNENRHHIMQKLSGAKKSRRY